MVDLQRPKDPLGIVRMKILSADRVHLHQLIPEGIPSRSLQSIDEMLPHSIIRFWSGRDSVEKVIKIVTGTTAYHRNLSPSPDIYDCPVSLPNKGGYIKLHFRAEKIDQVVGYAFKNVRRRLGCPDLKISVHLL